MQILVTGTRTGIGRALAEHFLQAGHTVIGCSRRQASIDHDHYDHYEIDLTDSEKVVRMFRDMRRRYGHLDALVNNAGTSTMNHFMLTPDQVTQQVFDLNFFAVLSCCREAVRLLAQSSESWPAILTLSTVAVPWALEGHLAYSASKSAVEQLVKVMSKELSGQRIRINGIGIPPVDTVLTRTVPQHTIDALIQRQAVKRLCTVADVTGPVEFLLSPEAAFVTGETLYLGGVS